MELILVPLGPEQYPTKAAKSPVNFPSIPPGLITSPPLHAMVHNHSTVVLCTVRNLEERDRAWRMFRWVGMTAQ